MKRLTIIPKRDRCNWTLPFFGKHVFWTCVFMLFMLTNLSGQKIKATGTGNTTGHIATLSVTNSSSLPLKINEQVVYIPSDGAYQPYVARIPETTIPPKGTTDIPVNGYCADVHTPPVPNGTGMPPLDNWIPVGDASQPIPNGTTNIIPNPTKPGFTPTDIPGLINSPGYTPDTPGAEGDIVTNWPGTDIPVGGVIDPKKYPEDFAPVIVDILDHIEIAADIILNNDEYPTPFANDPVKERESVIQQTFWIAIADITGDEYNYGDFTEKVYDQFQTTTGKSVAVLPMEQKEQVDTGIEDFWKVFTATGVEAKVISVSDQTKLIDQPSSDAEGQPSTIADHDADQCNCGKALMTVYYLNIVGVDKGEGAPSSFPRKQDKEKDETKLYTPDTLKIKAKDEKVKLGPGDSFTIRVNALETQCKNCKASSCDAKNKKLVMLAKGLKDFGKEKELVPKKKGKDDKIPHVDTYDDVNVKVLKPEKGAGDKTVEITFKITWSCEAPKCGKSDCKAEYKLHVLRK